MSAEQNHSLNNISPFETRTDIVLPEASEILAFMREEGIPSYRSLERAQAWLHETANNGLFDADGNLYDEAGKPIVTRRQYDKLEAYYGTDNWLLSKDEVVLLEHVAGTHSVAAPEYEAHPYSDDFTRSKKQPEETPFRAKLKGHVIDVHGVSSIFGDEVEEALALATPDERREGLTILQESAMQLMALNHDIREKFTQQAAERGSQARHKREALIADKKHEEAYNKGLRHFMQQAATDHPDFVHLSSEEQEAIQNEILQQATDYAEAAKQDYLAERARIFGSSEVKRLEKKAGSTLESPTDKKLKKWDEDNQPILESIAHELATDIARGLGQVALPKGEVSAVNAYIKTDERLKPDRNGRLEPTRPMELSKANIKARRNFAYAGHKEYKKPGENETPEEKSKRERELTKHRWTKRKEFQPEMDREIHEARREFSDLLTERQRLTTEQMELYQEREAIKYGNATAKLLAQIS